MSQRKWIAAFDVPDRVRDKIRSLFPPVYPVVHLNQITIAYAVDHDYPIPVEPIEITVVGTVLRPTTQALCVSVGDHLKRPDGRPYFITVSTRTGVAPHLAGTFEFSEVKILPPDRMFKFSAVAKLNMRRKAETTSNPNPMPDPLEVLYRPVAA